MFNVWTINSGNINSREGENPLADLHTHAILKYNSFVVIEAYKNMLHPNFLIKGINIKDDPDTNNITNISNLFEGVRFINEEYSLKKIQMEVLMIEDNGKKYNDLILEVKDIFADIRGVLEYYYRGEMMELEVVKDGAITFWIYKTFKTFTINWIWKPFFQSKEIIDFSWVSTSSQEIIKFLNKGHRIYPDFTIKSNWGVASWLKIDWLTVKEEIVQDDIISVNYAKWQVLKNGEEISTFWTLQIIKKNWEVPIEFMEKTNYPALNQLMDPTTGGTGTWIVFVSYNSDAHNAGQTYPVNTITNLKKITLFWRNQFQHSVDIFIKLYTDNTKTTLITEYKMRHYWGQNIDNPFIEIDWLWFNLSAYPSFYIHCYVDVLWSVTSSFDEFWIWDRNVSWGVGEADIGSNQDVQTYNFKWVLEGYAWNYESDTVMENCSGFDYSGNYKNNYL